MIHFIRGTLCLKHETGIVVETGGIGYDIKVPGNSSLYLKKEGEEITCYTAMIIREDDISLYGFSDRASLELFRLLITVNGVGAKAAVSILSSLTSDQLKTAIAFEDDKALSAANGIGKKTAQRIVLELKDKVGSVSPMKHTGESAETGTGARDEAVNGLIALGYSKAEAVSAISGVEGDSAEEILKKSLKNLF